MFANTKTCILLYSCIVLFACNASKKESTLTLEPVSNSTYIPDSNYSKDFAERKRYYEACTKTTLFTNAFYLQPQDKINIGSINNQHEINVNKGVNILDTSKGKSPFNLMTVVNSSNCSDSMRLTGNLRAAFYREVATALSMSPASKSLLSVIDTTKMVVKIGSIYTDVFIQDSVISRLNSTKDSALLHYKEQLLNPENVLLAETVEVLEFSAEFPLKMKLSPLQETLLTKPFAIDSFPSKNTGTIELRGSQYLRVQLNKRYTVLGKFVQVKIQEAHQ